MARIKARLLPALAGLLLLVPACGESPLTADCDEAQRYLALARQVRSHEDVTRAFRALGSRVPDQVQTPLDARIHLAREAAACGCEGRTHALAQLGAMLLERGDTAEAVRTLETSVRTAPALDAYETLALAYDAQGDAGAARDAREKAASLKGAWDR